MKEDVNGNMYKGWKPPTINMIKLNTNGASKSDKVAGCGGILRDHKGGHV